MKTLTWKRSNWRGQKFLISIEQGIIGQLTFFGLWKFNAVYTESQTQLQFAQNSFWDRRVLITMGGKAVGEIHSGLFGEQILKLVTGEKFIIYTSLWEQEAYWKTEKGEIIIKYQQAAMSSMGNGLIKLTNPLTCEMQKLLISSGLFARKLARKRIARTMVIMIIIIAAVSRL